MDPLTFLKDYYQNNDKNAIDFLLLLRQLSPARANTIDIQIVNKSIS